MKKNKMMRIASALLVAVLMTTCVISGTFAKYVTSADSSDSARVAKWGVAVTATSDGFENTYAADDDDTAIVSTVVSKAASADTDADDVVAPGTFGTLTDVVLSGSPEVAVEVSYAANVTLSGWTLTGDNAGTVYCPIKVVFDQDTADETTITCTGTLAEFEAAIEEKIAGYTYEYDAGTDLSTAKAPAISWAWDYFVDKDTDVKDTDLGNQAANGTASTITIEITTTVTQID